MGLHETKKLLHNEGNGQQIEKAAHTMGEKSLPVIHSTGINNQSIQGAQNLKSQNNQ
jgi:hypothetical protein